MADLGRRDRLRPGRHRHPQGAQRAARRGGRPRDRLDRRRRRRRADGDLRSPTSSRPATAREIPHGVTNVPLQGLTGSHAYAQGKTAGNNAGGGDRAVQAGLRPVGHAGGQVDDRRRVVRRDYWRRPSASRTSSGVAQGISRARYYPGVKPVKVKLLAEPGSLRLIGAQMVGGEGIKERADFLAHGGQERDHPRRPGRRWRTSTRRRSARSTSRSSSPPKRSRRAVAGALMAMALLPLAAGELRALPAGRRAARIAAEYSAPGAPATARGRSDMFWRRVFAPIYRRTALAGCGAGS